MKTAYQIAQERRYQLNQNKLLEQYRKKEAEQSKVQSSSSKKDGGYKFGKITGTILDFAGDVIEGCSKAVEGIADFGVSLLASDVGYAVGIFNPAVMMQKVFNEDKFNQKLEDFAKKDLTGKSFGKLDDAVSKNSYINDLGQTGQNIVHGVGEGIGGMLPAVAVTVATGGAGAPSMVSQIASTATFALGAGGNATEQALNEGASVNKAVAYGTLVGGTEALIETASGKILGGTNIFKPNALKESMKGGAKAVARNFAEEGLEEVISEYTTPMWKKLTYGDKYEAPSTKQLIESFVTGGLTATAMGGAQIAVDTAKYGRKGVEFNSKMEAINELNQEEYQKEVNGELTNELRQEYATAREKLTLEAKDLVNEMTSSKKEKTLNRIGGEQGFNSISNFNAQKTAIEDTVNSYNEKTGNNLKVDYVTDKDAPYNGFYDRSTNSIKVFEGAENSYSVVLAHEMTHSIENNKGYNDLSNEVLNLLGKDKVNSEYAELRKYDEYKDLSETELNKEIVANYLSETFAKSHKELRKLVVKNRNIVTKVLDYVKNKLSSIGQKGENYKQLQALKTKLQNVLDNNVVEDNKSVETDREIALQYSRKTRKYLFNKDSLNKYLDKKNIDSHQFRKNAYSTLKDLYSYTDNKTFDDVAVQVENKVFLIDSEITDDGEFNYGTYKMIEFEDSNIARKAKEVINNDIRSREENREDNGNTEGKRSFSINKTSISKHIQENKRSDDTTRKESSNNIRGVSRENANRRITGLESYSEEELNSIVKNYVIEKLNDSDDYNTEIVDIIFNGSRTKGAAKSDSDLDVIVEFKGDWREDSLFDLLNENPLEIDGIKVDINPVTEGKSGTARDYYERTNEYNPRVVKDSQGTILTKEQSEYFKNSKVVDDNGNLLFLYHGSPSAEFNIFDEQSQGKNTSSSDKGFYFTNNKDVAETFSYETKPSSIVTVKRTEKKGSVKSFYLNIENMLDLDNLTQSQIDFIAQSNPLNLPVEEVKRNIKQFVDAGNIQGIKMYLNFDAIKGQYDGIKASMYSKYQVSNDSALDGVYEFVAFHPEQIKLTTNKNPSDNPDIRYSVKKNYSGDSNKSYLEQLDLWENNKWDYRQNLKMLDSTPQILLDIGITDNPIAIPPRKMQEIVYGNDNHIGIGIENAKKLEQAISDPQYILESYTVKDSIVVVTNLVDANNNPIIASIALDGTGNFEIIDIKKWDKKIETASANIITSAYGKANINNWIDRTKIIYSKDQGINKKRIMRRWVQFPNPHNSSTNNISQNLEKDTPNFKKNNNDVDNDTKYSIKKYSPSQGQNAKFRANYKSDKVYSKEDAVKIYNELLIGELATDNAIGYFKGKGKSDVINQIFIAMNKGTNLTERMHLSDKLADYLVQNALAEDYYNDNGFNDEALMIVDSIKAFMHSLNLDSIKDEINHKYGKKNGISLLWGKKSKDKGISIDSAVQELNDMGIQIDMTDSLADQFFEMLRIYDRNKKLLSPKAEKLLSSVVSKDELNSMKKQLADNILRAWTGGYGSKSIFQKSVDNFVVRISNLKTQVYQTQKRNRVINSIVDKAQYFRDIANRTYVSAGDIEFDSIVEIAKKLSSVKYRSDVSKAKTRGNLIDIMEKLLEPRSKLFGDGLLNPDIQDELKVLIQNKNSGKELSFEELVAVENILSHMQYVIKNYDYIFKDGKRVKVRELVEKGYKAMENVPEILPVKGSNLKRAKYEILSPRIMFEKMDGYQKNGIMTSLFNDVKAGETKMMEIEMDMMEDINKFYQDHKSYQKTLTEETREINGITLTKDQAMYLVLLSKRDQALLHLYSGGVQVKVKKGKQIVNRYLQPTTQQIHELEDSFNDLDKEYMEIARKLFNEKGRNYKMETDFELRGYTNIEEGSNYIPIKSARSTIASKVSDVKSLLSNFDVAQSQSFNREVKEFANNKIECLSLSNLLNDHSKNVAMYAGLAVPLQNLDVVYNRRIYDVDEKGERIPGTEKTIKSKVAEKWDGAEKYIATLMQDIQGVKRTNNNTVVGKTFGKIRSNYGKFQLGFNLKTIVNQLTAVFSSYKYVSFGSIFRGFSTKIDFAEMDNYCTFAKYRDYDQSYAKSELLLSGTEKVGSSIDKFTDMLMKPINKADRLVMGLQWNACQIEIEKSKGLKVGTEENKKEAGKLLETIIRETQPGSASERGALYRTDNELIKSGLMFMGQPAQLFSLVYEGQDKVATAKKLLKIDPTNKEYQKILEDGKELYKKAIVNVGIQIALATAVAQAFKYLLDKDDEEKSFSQELLEDLGGQVFGLVPFVRDAYSYFVDGYEVSNFAIDGMNALYESIKATYDIIDAMANGEPVDDRKIASTLRKNAYTIGQLTGIPTRNFYNYMNGITKWFSPTLGYKMDNTFYKQNYNKDLERAIESGDEELANTIIEVMIEEKNLKTNKQLIEVYRELYEKGYKVLPTAINTKFSHDGVEYTMTAKEKKKFATVYNQSTDKLVILVKNPNFKSASDEVKTKAINLIYDYYYAMAKEDYGLDVTNLFYLLGKTSNDISKLSLILAEISQIESDLDKNGKTISGSKKNKIFGYLNKQKIPTALKYIIMGYLGYKNTQGENLVKAYLNKLGLSKEEKESLLIMAGYLEKDAQ